MRFSESKIKQAILHPEEEMREQALHYFSNSRSQDDTVMPLVIQAVEKYGRNGCQNLQQRSVPCPLEPGNTRKHPRCVSTAVQTRRKDG